MAKSKGGTTVAKVWSVCEPVINDLGLILWDVRYVKEGADWILRIFIDKDNESVGISDCVEVTRAIDKPLDELDPIESKYSLEVCSPGIERELIREQHFAKFIGADVKVKMLRPIEGIGREFAGVLKSYDNGNVLICDHSNENEITISTKDTSWIKLDDFD